MPIQSPAQLYSQYRAAVARLYQRTESAHWGFSQDAFTDTLYSSLQHWNPEAGEGTVEKFLDSLHVEDLALAAACSLGIEPAWNDFVARFRPILYRAARAIAGDEIRGRELADSLYADLYGLEIRDGRRRSLLLYFHGRSSLATWLHAVLAQRMIDAHRRERRIEPIDARMSEAMVGQAVEQTIEDDPPDPHRERYLELLRAALDASLRALAPRERLRLSYYYLEELTLKQISALLGEHESTVSRRLGRTRKLLRRQVERALRRDQHLSDDQIQLCYDYATREWPFDLSRALSEAPCVPNNPKPKR